MSRRTERAILGVLGFAAAVLVLVVGARLMVDDQVDVAAGPMAGVDVTAPAAPNEDADRGVAGDGVAPDLLVVSTTAGSTGTVVSSTVGTAAAGSSSTTSSLESSVPTSASVSTEVVESTVTPSETTIPSDDGDVGTSATSTSSSTTLIFPGTIEREDLSDIEREIVRLTNELRTDPAGPHRRQGPMPQCVIDDEIEVDRETGHPKPVRRLTPSQPVSIRMSRNWSQQMADADAMSHRSAASQDEIYAELGITWATRGENVAWAVGYDVSEVAQLFFRGWRESDGHYCNMMAGEFTEIGVGHVRTDGGKDFATQNFYRPR